MIDINQQALLELIKASLFGAKPQFPDGVDWDAVLTEATDQTVIALAAPTVPAQEAEKWRVPAAQNTAHFLRVVHEQTNLIQLFGDAGIPTVILKGSAAAMYYPSPLCRTMGDVDFIVPPERFDDARRLMEENGYDFEGDYGDDRDYSYRKNGVVLELHHRYSDAGWDIDPLIFDGISHAVTREIVGRRFPALPDEINGMVLLDHVRHHLYGGLGIRQIIDWMMFVRAALSDDAAAERFLTLARAARLETFALTMTKMCRLWFGLPGAAWCDGADEATARQLLETVFAKGNFGRKDPYVYRPMEEVSRGVKELGFFRFLQRTGRANWQASERHRILRPFAWLYQLFRYMGRGIAALFRGDRFRKDISAGNEKSDFYQRLGIN